jgi:hypothetical protein
MRFIGLVLSVALVFSACGDREGPVIGHFGTPIINGDFDNSSGHMAVVALTDYYGLCTGTLITPDVILTAAHCVYGRNTSSFTVYFGTSLNNSTQRLVSEKLVHPSYDDQDLVNDIALLRLSSQAPSSASPIPYLPKSKGISVLDVGGDLEFTGFGEDEYGQAGVKLTIHNALNWVCTNSGGCNVGQGYYAAENTICYDENPGGPCSGDSGGPAFILRDGTEYVAGITSYGDQNCDYYGCSTKVDEFETFIIGFIGGALGAACSSASQCDSGYCVDGVCCENSCPGICDACNVGGEWGTCTRVPNDTPCPDNDRCNGTETCQAGSCVPGDPLDCSNANKCTDDACDPASGCLFNPVANGTACSNGNPCDGEESCLGGVCQSGQSLDCDDRNPCTGDSCSQAAGGCQHTPVTDGTFCGGGLCGDASCSAGQCVSASTNDCDDQDPCTKDWCNPDTGCINQPEPNGYACGECMMCWDGACVEAPDCGGSGCGCQHSRPASSEWAVLMLLFAALVILGRKP